MSEWRLGGLSLRAEAWGKTVPSETSLCWERKRLLLKGWAPWAALICPRESCCMMIRWAKPSPSWARCLLWPRWLALRSSRDTKVNIDVMSAHQIAWSTVECVGQYAPAVLYILCVLLSLLCSSLSRASYHTLPRIGLPCSSAVHVRHYFFCLPGLTLCHLIYSMLPALHSWLCRNCSNTYWLYSEPNYCDRTTVFLVAYCMRL